MNVESTRLAVSGMLIGIAMTGCAPAADPAAVAAVQVITEGAALPSCRLLGAIQGQDTNRWVPGGPFYEVALVDLKKKAVLGGGNEVVLDKVSEPRDTEYLPAYTIEAKLFACPVVARLGASATTVATTTPTASVSAAAVARAPTLICEPDCSPGYTCLRGTCVSACNPLCGVGERCGADRICHSLTPAPGSSAPLP